MSSFLGYGMSTPEFFEAWQGTNGSPVAGTVNWILGFNDTIDTFRYTKPILYKNTEANYDDNGMPIISTIRKKPDTPDPLIRDYLFVINENCPENYVKDGIIYNKLTELLDFMSLTYNKNGLYTKQQIEYWFPPSPE